MPEVLDISSDEEQGCSEEGLKNFDYDWIREFLGMSDDEGKSEDSDEVVIIHENKPQSKTKPSSVAGKDVDDDGDDDDCVVLDGDPENDVTCVDDEANESEEFRVVGERGQIACRDYAHPRHLCVKFPFSSTPHEMHCNQCYCYVCDSLAPCLMWGTGLLSSDHCHANDKIEIWTVQRKNFKVGNGSPLPASTNCTSLLAGHRQSSGVLPLDVIQFPPDSMLRNPASGSTAMHAFSSLDSIAQNQPSRPTRMFALSPSLNSGVQKQVPRANNIPAYTPAANLTIPDGVNHGISQQSAGSTLARNRYQPHSVAKQWLGVRRHAIHRERGSGASSLGPQFIRSHTMPNRLANAGNTLTVNHSGYVSSGFSNHVNPALQHHDKYHTATGFLNDKSSNEPNGVWLSRNLPLSPHQNSQAQSYSQPLPQSNDGHNFYQSCIQGNEASPPCYVACLNSNQLGNEHQIGNHNENASGNIAQYGIASQETSQLKPQEESPSESSMKADISAFGSSWTENTSQNVEHLFKCSQGLGSINQLLNANESGNHVTDPESVGLPTECSHLPSSLVDFENWLLAKDSIPRVSDGALPSELNNIPSPDLGPVDTGMLLW